MMSTEVVRICVTEIEEIMTIDPQIPVGKVTSMKLSFVGSLAQMMHFFSSLVFTQRNMNYTVVKGDTLNNCEASIALNHSDYAVGIFDFPIKEDYEKINVV